VATTLAGTTATTKGTDGTTQKSSVTLKAGSSQILPSLLVMVASGIAYLFRPMNA